MRRATNCAVARIMWPLVACSYPRFGCGSGSCSDLRPMLSCRDTPYTLEIVHAFDMVNKCVWYTGPRLTFLEGYLPSDHGRRQFCESIEPIEPINRLSESPRTAARHRSSDGLMSSPYGCKDWRPSKPRSIHGATNCAVARILCPLLARRSQFWLWRWLLL